MEGVRMSSMNKCNESDWRLFRSRLPNTMSTSSQKGADSSSPFWAGPYSSGTYGWFLVSSTAGNYCSWDT